MKKCRTPTRIAAVLILSCVLLASCGGPEHPRIAVTPLAKICVSPGTYPSERPDAKADTLRICSFNIKFLGQSPLKENASLAEILDGYDIIVVQELIAPPYADEYPDGTEHAADAEAAAFFERMSAHGFVPILSEEDTGPVETIHNNGSATEWFVAFYRPEKVAQADDLPHGFLAADHSKNAHYDRVPYGFAFRTPDGAADFVLVSVHLNPTKKSRRLEELQAVADWVSANDSVEKDFIIVGDMNIQTAHELGDVCPDGFVSLNAECGATNTNPNGPKPYDHAMYRRAYTAREIDESYGFWLIDLVTEMKQRWETAHPDERYPGYSEDGDVNVFPKHYSDHDPVDFRMVVCGEDDD